MGTYVQYGCGLSAPEGWLNFDASPTLRLQRKPLVGTLLGNKLGAKFPKNVRYGDITKGLPVADGSADAVYCSHVLEHLSHNDFKAALRNTYKVLKPGGVFRLVMPDLEPMVRSYIQRLEAGKGDSASKLMRDTILATEDRPRGSRAIAEAIFGNARHLWLWDYPSTIKELEEAGFKNIRKCTFNDSGDPMFDRVEDESRFENAVCLQCTR